MRHIQAESIIAAALALAGCACGDDATGSVPGPPRAPADAIPPSRSVAAGDVQMGMIAGKRRWMAKVDGFSIATRPTTRLQYRQRVQAGACTAPDFRVDGCANEGAKHAALRFDDAPEVCATPEQATSYCTWVGGALPTPEQWFLAARGVSVTAYSWGNEGPNCERHWLANSDPAALRCADATAAVGKHAAGASPSGVEDVLSVWQELVGTTPATGWVGCKSGRACAVSSVSPGRIERIAAIPKARPDHTEAPTLAPIAFRCAWAGGAS